jgi:putative ATP-dependent endonuclease of the OLD family
MKIEQVVIKNVKSFKEKTVIEFNERFNVLIGPNGSGKSNLLDILAVCLRNFFFYPMHLEGEADSQVLSIRPQLNNTHLLLDKHYGDNSESYIAFTFRLEKSDIVNIDLLINNYQKLIEASAHFKNGRDFQANVAVIKQWTDTSGLAKSFTFEITEYQIQPTSTDSAIVLSYMNYLEMFDALGKFAGLELKNTFQFFGPNRNINMNNLGVSLASNNFYVERFNNAFITSRTQHSVMLPAILYFAEKHRTMEAEGGDLKAKWEEDTEVNLVTRYLGKLGYHWNLDLKGKFNNTYEISLSKDGQKFSILQASSGEREIINFLLGIFAFNIKDGILLIDEPELHLHPQWQTVLVNLFLELSDVTHNQFIISTHSARFINEKSVSYVLRVYKENKMSRVITNTQLSNSSLKDLLHVINSTNNERMLFADLVILVEGLTDRLVFSRMWEGVREETDSMINVEIIEIHGKNNKKRFSDFLDALHVPNYFIADLDYLNEAGSDEIKSLFTVDSKRIANDVIKNEKSRDGKALVQVIQQAIATGRTDELKNIWEYIASFRQKLLPSLDETQFSRDVSH